MNQFSDQDQKEIMVFIKDWLKIHGYKQKDFASKLKIDSNRTSEILKKMKDLYKKGGMYSIAQKLIKIEQSWLDNKSTTAIKTEDLPYSQMDIDYKVDGIDALNERMEKDHQSWKN